MRKRNPYANRNAYFAGKATGKKEAISEVRMEIKEKCDEINYIVSDLPYSKHRAIQELLSDIMKLVGEGNI